jgi:tetratricopeptide (TPR) repeat protein
VIDRFRDLYQSLRRHPSLSLLVLALLALIGIGGYITALYTWAQYNYWAAQRALERRDFTQARDRLERCLQVWPTSAATHFLAARAARRAGAYDDAERHLNACRQWNGVPEALELERALLRAQRGELPRVEGYLLHCVQKEHPDVLLILEALTRGYMKTYQLGQAIECLNGWLERQPDDVQALTWRGYAQDLVRRFDEALTDYRRAVELDPAAEEARLRLAELLLHSHQAQEALAHFEHLRHRRADSPVVLLGLARCRRELGQAEEARQLLETLLAKDPRDYLALTERGKLALEAGETVAAEAWLRQALAVSPAERETTYLLLQCLNRLGKKKEAEECQARLGEIDKDFKRIVEVTREILRSPDNPALRCEAGTILLRNGQPKEGLRWLDSALQQDPRHPETHRTLADYYARAGQPDVAAQHRRLALQGRVHREK